MTDPAHKFHEQWLGMVQPSEGLVVSVPVLVDAQCMQKQDRSVQERLLACTARDSDGRRYVPNLSQLLEEVLGLAPERFDTAPTLPKPLRLYVPEGKQELRPTLALKRLTSNQADPGSRRFKEEADLSAAASAGQDYVALLWDIPPEVELDEPETVTGTWEYPAQAKFDRLLRECRVPIGLLFNGRELRLTYAPHGASSGWLSFRIDAMCEVGGRPILDALVMLLGQERWFAVAQDVQLPALLEQSRGKQGEVTNALARQMFDALEELLAGFSAAAEHDRHQLLRRALEEGEEGYVYSGLLTVLLRLVFTLYCEDRGLLPVEHELFAHNYSLFGLYDELEKDHGRYPDSMDRRLGAYARLLSLFRAMYQGIEHGDPGDKKAGLFLPQRKGDLFDPNRFPFLEGWAGGSAPFDAEQRARVDVPTISDGTIYRVLKNLIVLDGQRLSYRALDVEQIGSVYEALMGFDVERIVGHRDVLVGGRTPPDPSARPASSVVSPASPGAPASAGALRLRLSSKRGAARVWLDAAPLLHVPVARRAAWLTDELGFDKAIAAKISDAVKTAKSPAEALTALEPLAGKHPERVGPGALVIQPGPERRRTSSHYTPRSLSEPIVRKTLDPLIRCMGDRPSSEALLSLKICDPAMGSGAFLVAACRYLADHVVAAWTREGTWNRLSDSQDDVVNHARRLVAQRCLYGVDKNKYAVQLARLSLWLVTMAKHEPFTFVDHALRHGDSLVGLKLRPDPRLPLAGGAQGRADRRDLRRAQPSAGRSHRHPPKHPPPRRGSQPPGPTGQAAPARRRRRRAQPRAPDRGFDRGRLLCSRQRQGPRKRAHPALGSGASLAQRDQLEPRDRTQTRVGSTAELFIRDASALPLAPGVPGGVLLGAARSAGRYEDQRRGDDGCVRGESAVCWEKWHQRKRWRSVSALATGCARGRPWQRGFERALLSSSRCHAGCTRIDWPHRHQHHRAR